MKKWITKIIEDQKFTPTFFGIFLNPFYFARKNLYENIKNYGNKLTGKILDIGCGTKPYKKYLNGSYIGLDIQNNNNLDNNDQEVIFFDGKDFPLEDNSINSILCTQVLEHVKDHNHFFSELRRVLKKDGLILITVPFLWAEHEVPNDFSRFTTYGLKKLLTENNFDILETKKLGNNFSSMGQFINSYLYDILPNKFKYNILTHIFIYGFFNLIFLLISKLLPKNDNFYLDNLFLIKLKDK